MVRVWWIENAWLTWRVFNEWLVYSFKAFVLSLIITEYLLINICEEKKALLQGLKLDEGGLVVL